MLTSDAPPPARNARCPCGSGKRYKECHGALPVAQPNEALALLLHEALAMQSAGRLDEAAAAYERALAADSSSFDALHMLGVVRHQLGDHRAAIALIERAVARFAGHAPAHSNLGLALLAEGRAVEALASLDRALALAPGFVEALNNRGHALVRLQRHAEAVESFERALAIDPKHAAVLSNHGNALIELRRYADAANVFARLVDVAPDYEWALGSLLGARLFACDWNGFDALAGDAVASVRAGRRAVLPFTFLAVSDAPEDQLACARSYGRAFQGLPSLAAREPRSGAKLRLGYLSADFRDHAVAYLIADLFETHDRDRFEVLAFSFGPPSDAPIRRRLASACDEFIDVRSLGDRAVAEAVRARDVDIAVDLQGLTSGARPGVLAQRPAPVQVNWLGYPGTTGLDGVDYIVADPRIVPEGDERWYSERVVRLPDSYQANDRRRPLPSGRATRHDAGLPEQGFVFCSFNNNYKILPSVFDVWMRLLLGVPGSVLWLLSDNDAAVANLRSECTSRGVDADRLVFAPRTSLERHMDRLALSDLVLDTYPYNAHTTASDALWAGVPVVTCEGRTFAARVCASLLHAAGVPELVTASLPAYEALALDLATSPARLAALRTRLDQSRATCALFDTPRFCRHLESAYAMMWARHARGEAPPAFLVPREER